MIITCLLRSGVFNRLFIIFILLGCKKELLSQTTVAIVDSFKKTNDDGKQKDEYIKNCFFIADNFMEINQYDSAQLWLNKIAEVLPIKVPSVTSYFLSSRQAEVYYYNGLQRLGLQESERSLTIAQALKDSFLLADAYNFIGLFLINLDSNRSAISNLQKGIMYSRQPPYPSTYLSLTKPYHLYGNIAEAYEKIGSYDSAVYLNRVSLQLALQIGWMRGVAVAHSSLGSVFLRLHQPDSAIHHYILSGASAEQGGAFDVELFNYGGLAKAADMQGNTATALQWLQKGFVLMKNNPSVNNFFANQFLDDAIFIFKKYHYNDQLAEVLENKSSLLQKQIQKNNLQMNVILNAGLRNETRLLQLEVEQVKQLNEISNIRVYLLLAFLILGIGAFLLYRYKANQKLHIMQLQNKISQDLHDDVGSSLSSMQVYSTVAEQLMESQPAKAKAMLKKINNEAAAAMENIADIVWSMKTEKEQLMQLGLKIKNFVSDVLSASNINYVINIEVVAEGMIKNIQAKKNILMIVKEAVNNTVKHSNASHVAVSIKKIDEHICIQVADDGIGFALPSDSIKGQGFINMQGRTEELKGYFEISSIPGKGTTVSALLPIPIISDTH